LLEAPNMEINVAGISPMDGVTPIARIGTYPSSPNSEVTQVKPNAPDSSQPAVKFSLSPKARQLLKDASLERAKGNSNKACESGKDAELSKADQQTLRQLQARDLHVKMHEQQHLASAGAYAKGGANFSYQIGPDGKSYAVGGEVQLDVGPVSNDPKATIVKAQVIRRSALAPADPSGADRSIAAAASQMEANARMQLMEEALSKNKSPAGSTSETNGIKKWSFQFKAYQKIMTGAVGIGRHLNLQA
ncbi:MAG TPA: putative metalloprotease CJM1_0395 family protein, partial [Bacillota bacterium]|nr:putative metalloprotease CJM1_0395 family protein [Bacillota bacterium]